MADSLLEHFRIASPSPNNAGGEYALAEEILARNNDLKQQPYKSLPRSAYYIPDFINKDEEQFLLGKVYSAPKPKWKQLSNRRLQNWGGLPHPKGMIQEPLPEWLEIYSKRIADLEVFGERIPNHVLVNEYLAGQGIMPHEDGPLFYPTITTINLGSHTVLDYYTKVNGNCDHEEMLDMRDFEHRYVGSLLLERCSLLIVQEDLYTSFLHGIKETCHDKVTDKIANLSLCSIAKDDAELVRTTRVSLTIRHVPRVLKAKALFGRNFFK